MFPRFLVFLWNILIMMLVGATKSYLTCWSYVQDWYRPGVSNRIPFISLTKSYCYFSQYGLVTSWSLLVSTYVSSLVMFQSIGRFVVFHLPPSLVLLCQSIHSNQLSHVDIIECQPLWLLNLSQTPPYLCLQLISFLIHCQWSDYVGLLDLEVAETTHCLEIIHISVHVAFIAFKIYFRLNLHMGVIKKKSHFFTRHIKIPMWSDYFGKRLNCHRTCPVKVVTVRNYLALCVVWHRLLTDISRLMYVAFAEYVDYLGDLNGQILRVVCTREKSIYAHIAYFWCWPMSVEHWR